MGGLNSVEKEIKEAMETKSKEKDKEKKSVHLVSHSGSGDL